MSLCEHITDYERLYVFMIKDVFHYVCMYDKRKSFIYARRMKSAKSVDETHFLSFTAIICTWDGTEGSNFHILDTMVIRDKMSGSRFGVIVAVDRPTMFTKPYP